MLSVVCKKSRRMLGDASASAALPRVCLSTSVNPAEKQALLDEAASLTRSLYRLCIRSVRLIRKGNENDEKEFAERELKRLNQPRGEGRMSMLSMLPPVDRPDELRSRAEYYMQYAREQFVQESDCLLHSEWEEQHIARYLYHLRRGDEHRHWLLSDMKFDDPYRNSFDHSRVNQFEEKAMKLLGSDRLAGVTSNRRTIDGTSTGNLRSNGSEDEEEEEEEAAFSDEEDDDEVARGPPSWYKNPRNP